MEKLVATTAIILGLSLTTFADGGLFQRGYNAQNGSSGYSYFSAKTEGDNASGVAMPLLPQHGQETNQPAPLGSGIAILLGLGTAYLLGKKPKEK